MASIAAVQGHEFDSATLARVSGLLSADVEELLGRLEGVHALIAFEREGAFPDGTLALVYRFVHVLYQDALHDSTSVEAHRMGASHRGSVDAFAWRADRSYCRTNCRTLRNGTGFLARVSALPRCVAQRDAALCVPRGHQARHTRPNCLSAAAAVEPSHRLQRELDLTFARLVPVSSVEGYASAEAEKISERLVALGESLNDAPATAAALSATWMIRIVRGDCLAAKDAGTRLVALARASNNDVLLINAHMHAQIACHHLGEFDEARTTVQRPFRWCQRCHAPNVGS